MRSRGSIHKTDNKLPDLSYNMSTITLNVNDLNILLEAEVGRMGENSAKCYHKTFSSNAIT